MRSRFRALSSLLCHKPWPLTRAVAPNLEPNVPIEEEKTPYFRPDTFYPAKLGDVFRSKYQLATKLGFGSGSTVWLARDLGQLKWQDERYVALKINATRGVRVKDNAENELSLLDQIQKANPQHRGWNHVRMLKESFSIKGIDDNEHLCFVFEPLREPLWIYRRRFVDGVLPPALLKIILEQVLHGLDYLHSECHIIHTDLKPDNIMLKPESLSIFEQDAVNEYKQPLPQKQCNDGRIIYLSRKDYGSPSEILGIVQSTDFGLSVSGETSNSGAIQAEVYRAPEVILDAGYSYSADIWNLGVMLWDLLQGTGLFDAADPGANNDQYQDDIHLAYITAFLGPAPKKLLENGRRTSMFYDEEGSLKHAESIPKDMNLSDTITYMSGAEKELFIKFVSKMLKWDPEQRSTAKALLDDPWLHSDD